MSRIFILLAVILFYCSCSTNNNNGTVTVVPLAPSNLTGTVVSTTQINLSWTDNATNEAGYKIERKTGNGNFAVVGSMGADLTTYNDLGLTPNTSYTYRVYAYNSAGNSLQYSNEVTISTQDSIPTWLTNGLVAYYPFNGNANDESGNGNNGTINGATLTTDRNGNGSKAYSFDGVNDMIQIMDDSELNFGLDPKFSISLWVFKVTANSGGIICKGEPLNGFGWKGWNFIHEDFQTGYPCVNNNSISCQNNSWVNIVITVSNGVITSYINGNQNSQFNCQNITSTSISTNTNLYIGLDRDLTNFFNGKLDDIRIYNRALSQSEITYLATH